MYRHILIAVADDIPERVDKALEVAQALKAPDGEVTLLHVLEAIPGYTRSYIPDKVMEEREQAARDMLSGIAHRAPLAVNRTVLNGHGGQTIVEHADAKEIDCIVISSHVPEFQDVFFGSTAAHVVRHAKCAVHVLR